MKRDLENAIISHIADFLLEMGKGFSFVARQKRLLIEDDEYFADLVFYNRLLRSFVVIEIKNHKLTHQDLGQLQLYVNYYDRYEKSEDENPTIGILLCSDKNDTAVRLALPEDYKTILASKYQLYIPTTEQFIAEINEVKRIARLKDAEKGYVIMIGINYDRKTKKHSRKIERVEKSNTNATESNTNFAKGNTKNSLSKRQLLVLAYC